MGHEVPKPELESLSKQYADLTMGLVGWPYLDLPFTMWRRWVQTHCAAKGHCCTLPACVLLCTRQWVGVQQAMSVFPTAVHLPTVVWV
jgi:hypothetical protein